MADEHHPCLGKLGNTYNFFVGSTINVVNPWEVFEDGLRTVPVKWQYRQC